MHLRQSTIEEQHCGLETPNKGDVKVPPCKEAFGAELQLCDLLWCETRADLVRDANVRSILACLTLEARSCESDVAGSLVAGAYQ
jgi:hypothetical protein